MDQSDNIDPHTDGTGTGLLGFCTWLGDQGLVTSMETRNLRVAVRRVLEATDGWERLDIRSLDLEVAARRLDESQASSLQPKTRTIYKNRLRSVVRLYLAYLDDPAGFRMSRGHQDLTPASTPNTTASMPPSQDGTGAGLVGFCQWLAEQGLVSVRRADQLCQAVRRVLAPDPDWERLEVRRFDVDGLLERLATATTPPLRVSTLNFYSSGFRKAVRWYLAYLDNPARFLASGAVPTQRRNRTVPPAGGPPAAHQPAAAPSPSLVYPFPLRGSHTIWLRLPADLTRDEAQRLATFIHALAMDAQPPPGPATAS